MIGIFCLSFFSFSIPQCGSSVEIPSGTTSINENAYSECAELVDLTLPDGLLTISKKAFYNCVSLKGALKIPDSVTTIGDYAFAGCGNITSLILSKQLQTLGIYSFSECISLSGSISIPDSVTKVSDRSFYFCQQLESVTLNKVQLIGEYSFASCINLKGTLTIPDTVTDICNYAFSRCSQLTSLSLGKNVKFIGNNTFSSCSKLEGSLIIPNSVEEIGMYTFSDCNKLTSLSLSNSIKKIGGYAFFFCTGLKGEVKIPDAVVDINGYTFYKCIGINSIVLGPNINSIGSNSFEGCSGLSGPLSLPDTITEIGSFAFQDCSKLTSLKLSSKTVTIGDHAFFQCIEIEGKLEIPDSVTDIGSYSFYYCRKLTSLSLGTSLKSVGTQCFRDCNRLKGSLVIPTPLVEINKGCFLNCNGIESVSFDSSSKIKSIENQLFEKCSSLSGEILIPLAVTTIGDSAFSECEKITSIILGNKIKSLGQKCFYRCSSLTGEFLITLVSNKNISIGADCFSYTNLAYIKYEGIHSPTCDGLIFEERPFYAVVTNDFVGPSFCELIVVKDVSEIPLPTIPKTPEQTEMQTDSEDPSSDDEIVINLDFDYDDIREDDFNRKLNKTFESLDDKESTQKVVIVNLQKIPFNSELKKNQFIKAKGDSTINLIGGNLNLVLTKSETVTVSVKNQEDSTKIALKGEGDLEIVFQQPESEKPKSLNIETNSQLNGSVSITVPSDVETVLFDSIDFKSLSSLTVINNNSEKVNITVNDVSVLKNSEASISNILINNSLKVPQSATIKFDNVDFSDASSILYDFDDFEWKNPFVMGKFDKPPNSLILNKNEIISDLSPPKMKEFSLVSGSFEEGKCADWLTKIVYGNSGFDFKGCVDNDQLKSAENKQIILKYNDDGDKGNGGNKLGTGPIIGIVIACIVVVAIVIVVVVVVIIKKKKKGSNDGVADTDELSGYV